MRGENEFDPQQNSEPVFSNRTVRFAVCAVCVGSVSVQVLVRSVCYFVTSVILWLNR